MKDSRYDRLLKKCFKELAGQFAFCICIYFHPTCEKLHELCCSLVSNLWIDQNFLTASSIPQSLDKPLPFQHNHIPLPHIPMISKKKWRTIYFLNKILQSSTHLKLNSANTDIYLRFHLWITRCQAWVHILQQHVIWTLRCC